MYFKFETLEALANYLSLTYDIYVANKGNYITFLGVDGKIYKIELDHIQREKISIDAKITFAFLQSYCVNIDTEVVEGSWVLNLTNTKKISITVNNFNQYLLFMKIHKNFVLLEKDVHYRVGMIYQLNKEFITWFLFTTSEKETSIYEIISTIDKPPRNDRIFFIIQRK